MKLTTRTEDINGVNMTFIQTAPRRFLFAGIGLILLSWSLATPMFGVPDENSHFIAVIGARHLDFDTSVEVEGFFASGYDCFVFNPEIPADCYSVAWDPSVQYVETRTSGYSPLFYLLASPPLFIFSDTDSFVAVRLWVTFLNFLLISIALNSILNTLRSQRAIVPLSLALLPFPLYFAGSISPSGTAYALALLSAALFYRILFQMRDLKTTLGFAFSLLGFIFVRRDSVIWLSLVLVCLPWFEPFRSRVKNFVYSTNAKKIISLLITGIFIITAFTANQYAYSIARQIRTLKAKDFVYGMDQVYTNFIQFQGVYGWLSEAIPNEIYMLLSVYIFGIIFYCFVFGRSYFQTLIGLLLSSAIFALVVGNAVRPNYIQGRYLFPIFAFLIVTLSYSLNQKSPEYDRSRQRQIKTLIFCMLTTASLVSFLESSKRFSGGSSAGFSEAIYGNVGPFNLRIIWLMLTYFVGLSLVFLSSSTQTSEPINRNMDGSTLDGSGILHLDSRVFGGNE